MAKRPSEEQAERDLAARLARAQLVMQVTVKGTGISYEIPPVENLPISFRRKVKMLTGSTITDLGVDGLHQFCCLWWASRLLAGEDVSLGEVEEEWDERCAGTRMADIATAFVDASALVQAALDGDGSVELSPES